jgi:hypothetical protein
MLKQSRKNSGNVEGSAITQGNGRGGKGWHLQNHLLLQHGAVQI